MNNSTTLQMAVKGLVDLDSSKYPSTICTVSEIDLIENTCTCTPTDGKGKFIEVQLSMSDSKGFLLIPTDGSIVVISQLNSFDAYVSMVSDVDQIYLNGDGEGGLVKVNDLVTKLNNIENKINAMIIWGATVTPPLATTPLGLTTALELANTKIKQG